MPAKLNFDKIKNKGTKSAMEGCIPTSKKDLRRGDIINARAAVIFQNKKENVGIHGANANSIRLTGRILEVRTMKA